MEEKIVFAIFAVLIGGFTLGAFEIRPILGWAIVLFCVGFWWTLFFVIFGG